MICKSCGRNNPSNTHICIYCGTPLVVSNGNRQKKNNQKQSESIIVALIIIFVSLLVSVAGVYIYKNNNTHKTSFGGSGGGSLPSPPFSTNDVASSQMPDDDNSVEEEIENEISTEQPAPTEQPSISNERLSKKNVFLGKADDIEWYSETYLETAQTQTEMNIESSIVYIKWDELLNEVYQYLKTIMSDSEFRQLQEDEIAWIARKENAIEAAGSEWEGGTGEPMARNMAAIQYTEERCYYLISLIN